MFIFGLLLLVLWGSYSPASAQEARSAVINKAKDEGKVVFYTTMSLPEVQGLSAIFEKQYPPIRVEVFRSGSGGITNRVQAEFNAKSYLVDVIQGVANRAMVPSFREEALSNATYPRSSSSYRRICATKKATGPPSIRTLMCWFTTITW